MATATAALDFKTVNDTQFIRIDGRAYDIRHPDALSLAQYKRVEHDAPKLFALMDMKEPTPADEAEMSRLLDRLVRVALDAPDEVQEKLRDAQRIAIVAVFTQLRSQTIPQTRGATRSQESPSAGRTSSRGSSGSTAATRKRG